MELQWHRLREVETGKGRRWGVAIFEGEEAEEARWLHGDVGGQHSEERHDSRGSRRQQLVSRGQR
jgi:hypothetical protein